MLPIHKLKKPIKLQLLNITQIEIETNLKLNKMKPLKNSKRLLKHMEFYQTQRKNKCTILVKFNTMATKNQEDLEVWEAWEEQTQIKYSKCSSVEEEWAAWEVWAEWAEVEAAESTPNSPTVSDDFILEY